MSSFALITGASKGIGKNIAVELAKRKINVLLTARSEDALQHVCATLREQYGIQANYFAADLSLPETPQLIFNWCAVNNYAVNILVNNAGFGLSGLFENYSANDHVNMLQVNVLSLVRLTALFLPSLKSYAGRAYILNIASSAAYQAVPYLAVYSASKAFVLSFSRALHYEMKKTNVSVTCISPGATDTDFPKRANVGPKGQKAAEKLNMQPADVAAIAVDKMFKRRTEVITGFVNKLGAALAWLAPKGLAEKTAAAIYE
ncbi:MAG TPA: SDR family oxidoreductase [Chitinophagaceae bacterium]|nr:SDR family oxidoreductase [Chitinophagaceae bacterium]